MDTLSDQEYLQRQYRDSSNLSARAGLHTRFSTEEYPWFHWVFDHFDIPENGNVLELGCGTGLLWRQNLGRIPHGWRITLSDASQGMVHEAEQGLLHTDLKLHIYMHNVLASHLGKNAKAVKGLSEATL